MTGIKYGTMPISSLVHQKLLLVLASCRRISQSFSQARSRYLLYSDDELTVTKSLCLKPFVTLRRTLFTMKFCSFQSQPESALSYSTAAVNHNPIFWFLIKA